MANNQKALWNEKRFYKWVDISKEMLGWSHCYLNLDDQYVVCDRRNTHKNGTKQMIHIGGSGVASIRKQILSHMTKQHKDFKWKIGDR